ncbi:MAG: transposase, partial [Solobacterium sp.]|nr:transposase [Solobacterium sp.]
CNEGDYEEFTSAVELYRKRFGCHPERILADKIYLSRKNREYCKEHGIRMSGPKLDKPKVDNSADIAMELKEIGERNEVEGKFGTAKRKYGLNMIKAKLEETARTDICMNLFVENLEHQIREDLRSFSLSLFEILLEFTYISAFESRLIYQG